MPFDSPGRTKKIPEKAVFHEGVNDVLSSSATFENVGDEWVLQGMWSSRNKLARKKMDGTMLGPTTVSRLRHWSDFYLCIKNKKTNM